MSSHPTGQRRIQAQERNLSRFRRHLRRGPLSVGLAALVTATLGACGTVPEPPDSAMCVISARFIDQDVPGPYGGLTAHLVDFSCNDTSGAALVYGPGDDEVAEGTNAGDLEQTPVRASLVRNLTEELIAQRWHQAAGPAEYWWDYQFER